MTTRNLDALFEPKAIALIGGSNRAGSIRAVLARNLFEAGFKGPIMAVNPHEQAVRSTLNYRSVADLPVVPDPAVLATPPATVPGLIEELGNRGCRAAVVVTAGFGEGDRMRSCCGPAPPWLFGLRPEDEPLLSDMVRRCSPQDIRLHATAVSPSQQVRTGMRLSVGSRSTTVLAASIGAPNAEMIGVARLIADPENEKAEFAVMVRSDMKSRRGLRPIRRGYCQ